MIVAVVGHRKIENTKEFEEVIEQAIIGLIKNGADTFLFGGCGQFDEMCYAVVTKLKEQYRLKRVYVRATFRFISEKYKNYLLSLYEETIFSPSVASAGRISYVKRNEAMIDICDVLLTYYDTNKRKKQQRNGNCFQICFRQKQTDIKFKNYYLILRRTVIKRYKYSREQRQN